MIYTHGCCCSPCVTWIHFFICPDTATPGFQWASLPEEKLRKGWLPKKTVFPIPEVVSRPQVVLTISFLHYPFPCPHESLLLEWYLNWWHDAKLSFLKDLGPDNHPFLRLELLHLCIHSHNFTKEHARKCPNRLTDCILVSLTE